MYNKNFKCGLDVREKFKFNVNHNVFSNKKLTRNFPNIENHNYQGRIQFYSNIYKISKMIKF
jgi:hypothetical protein